MEEDRLDPPAYLGKCLIGRVPGVAREARQDRLCATCQQHERPRLPYLVEAITAYWAHQPAPKFLPSATP